MAILRRNKSTIYGLNQELLDLAASIANETQTRAAEVGDLSTLEVVGVDNLTAAINALLTTVTENGADALSRSENLNDLDDKQAARTALELLTDTEIADRITQAQLALGTNFTVATIAERDVLEDLDNDDRILVLDGGEGTWVQYKPLTIDGETGLVTDWLVLMSEEVLQRVMSAAAIKAAYESNDDTNAFTDAQAAKLDGIDETDIQAKSALIQDLAVGGDDTANAPSAAAVRNYTQAQVAEGGALPKLETVVVTDNQVTLTEVPREGIAGILNFGTVRWLDTDGSSWDAPLIPTGDPKVFVVSADEVNQWDGNSVSVQYLYTPSAEVTEPELP